MKRVGGRTFLHPGVLREHSSLWTPKFPQLTRKTKSKTGAGFEPDHGGMRPQPFPLETTGFAQNCNGWEAGRPSIQDQLNDQACGLRNFHNSPVKTYFILYFD